MLRVLRHRDFALLWIGQTVSLLGDGIYVVAIAWLVYDISNAPERARSRGPCMDPAPGGDPAAAPVWSRDRYERRLVVIVADVLRVVAIGSLGLLALAGAVELWHVVLLVIVYGVGEALFQPAFTAIVPEVVPQDEILQASALKEVMEPIGFRFAGPAIGGLLIGLAGVGTALVIDAATFAASAVAVGLMSRQPRPVARWAVDLAASCGRASPSCGRAPGSGPRSAPRRSPCWPASARSRCCSRTSSATISAGTPPRSERCSRPEGSARSPRRCSSAASVRRAGT